MAIELTNGTDHMLSGMRVQVCTMLKGAEGFNLQEPLETIIDGPTIAIRAPQTDRWIITRWTPNHRVWRNPPATWELLLTGFRLHKLLPRRVRGGLFLAEHFDYARRRTVGMLSGAAMLVRREVIEEVGGFDESFHMYGEDNEWCLRIKRAGWQLIFEPEAVVMHHGGASSLKRWESLEKMRVQAEGYLLFLRRCLPRWRRVSLLATSCMLLQFQHAALGLKGRERRDVEQTLRLFTADLRRTLREG